MMNRSVMERQMFAKGGPVRYMQEGGIASALPMAAPAPAPIMPIEDPMAVAQEAINPAELESMLAQASQTIGDLDQAGSYEEVMNMMRGDEASVEERRSELAGLVGPEDAQQTPESVLTLVQPVIQMAGVDQGIGSIAEEEMNSPVTGDLAEGIMSTVSMGAPEVAPPVNFKDGGAVAAPPPPGLKPVGIGLSTPSSGLGGSSLNNRFTQYRDLFRSVVDPEQDAGAQEELKRQTQAQILFDIANTALAFTAPQAVPMSTAERLAAAATQTELFPTIAARTGALAEADLARQERLQELDLAAMQSAITAEEDKVTPDYTNYAIIGPDGTTLQTMMLTNEQASRWSNISDQLGLPGTNLRAAATEKIPDEPDAALSPFSEKSMLPFNQLFNRELMRGFVNRTIPLEKQLELRFLLERGLTPEGFVYDPSTGETVEKPPVLGLLGSGTYNEFTNILDAFYSNQGAAPTEEAPAGEAPSNFGFADAFNLSAPSFDLPEDNDKIDELFERADDGTSFRLKTDLNLWADSDFGKAFTTGGDYYRATGIGSIGSRFNSFINDVADELSTREGAAPTPEEVEDFRRLAAEGAALSLGIKTYTNEFVGEGGRAFSTLQDAVNELAQTIEGGLAVSDVNVLKALTTIEGNLVGVIEEAAKILPGRGNETPGQYTQSQISGAREQVLGGVDLLAAVRRMKRGMQRSGGGSSRPYVSPSPGQQDTIDQSTRPGRLRGTVQNTGR